MNLDERLQKDLSPDIYCLVHNKIVNLEQQCKKQKEVINRAIEYLETKRIREKAIIDVDVLEGILNEVSE